MSDKKKQDVLKNDILNQEQDTVIKTTEEVLSEKEGTMSGPKRTRRNNKNLKKKSSNKKYIIISVAAVVAILLLVYVIGLVYYNNRLCSGTTIKGIDCAGMTIEEAESAILAEVEEYKLEIVDYNGSSEYIYGKDIDISANIEGRLDPIFEDQKPGLWFTYFFKTSAYDLDALVSYDRDKLYEVINQLEACDESKMKEPVDAYVDFDESTNEYYINEGSMGSVILKETLNETIMRCITAMADSVNLVDEGCYRLQEITADDPSLQEQLELVKKYGKIEITMTFGEQIEKLDIGTVSKWISSVTDGRREVDSDAISEYVTSLAAKYDTYDKDRTLHTTYGYDVNVVKGDYGWKMDTAKTTEKIANAIIEGGEHAIEPEWIQTANAFGSSDWGNTYIEVNITEQHLYYYKDGELVVESDFVSGTVSKGRATPVGIYYIKYKKSPSILRGINWETPVTYWMPFFDGCGLHDATWRGSFGGTIYYYNGSHGCLNMPFNNVKTIYENIEAGVPILIYKTEEEPVEVVPVYETPWPDGYPTPKPTVTPVPTVTPAPTAVPTATVEVTATPEATIVPTATPVADTPVPTDNQTTPEPTESEIPMATPMP